MIPILHVYFCHNGLFFIFLHVSVPHIHPSLEYGILMCKDNNNLLNRAKKLKFFFTSEKKVNDLPVNRRG